MYQSSGEARVVTPHEVSMGRRQKAVPIIYIVGPIAALAGLLFGMDIGIISGALPLKWSVSTSTRWSVPRVASFTIAQSCPGPRRRRVSHPSPEEANSAHSRTRRAAPGACASIKRAAICVQACGW